MAVQCCLQATNPQKIIYKMSLSCLLRLFSDIKTLQTFFPNPHHIVYHRVLRSETHVTDKPHYQH